ncbi:hypothetical protein PENFLA_c041G02346 [Penicillium flavigenum]|uniref:Uncharacterized protein n=1 Tax=Penicillium flavigenum TaxID=254877 RepID=A0A1V6SJX4_9EURO|nr:hypothetical protein PENFLA_c041G02346 [Penicillium flavigenum]
MATLVFTTTAGPLQQVQIGPADVISTLSAAYTAAGWLGGLDGVKYILSRYVGLMRPSSNHVLSNRLATLLGPSISFNNSQVHILTSDHGPVRCEIPNAEEAFSGDHSTQLVGLTLCALAHECTGLTAVRLFANFLAPAIFKGANLLVDSLLSQLTDDGLYERVLNEGATRGLPELFTESTERLGLPVGDASWLRRQMHIKGSEVPVTEIHMVAGLLRWIAKGDTQPYFTRSGLVARTANCLKVVGYFIGSIEVWDGAPPRPKPLGPRCIVLVLGGSEETDHLMAAAEEIVQDCNQVYHYTRSTVGPMLYHSIGPHYLIDPECLQEDFEYIHHSIATRIRVSYRLENVRDVIKEDICGIIEWEDSQRQVSAVERSLASIYFPLLADHVAPCYSRIATRSILTEVRNPRRRMADAYDDDLTEGLARFRTTTLAIVIALVATLSDTQFWNIRHCISVDLAQEAWLEVMCGTINRTFASSVEYSEIVDLLAAVHVGVDASGGAGVNKEKGILSRRIIGWRNGRYSVIPSLLLEMKPSVHAVRLACRDSFYANLRVHQDGSIHSSPGGAIYTDRDRFSVPPQSSQQPYTISSGSHDPWVGPARPNPPSKPLYLSIERQARYNSPDVCFVGRVAGDNIGHVSVKAVLRAVARSFEVTENCDHRDADTKHVLNMDVKYWLQDRYVKPFGTIDMPGYLAVLDDPQWALFIAGQVEHSHGCIVARCLGCARKALVSSVAQGNMDGVMLIGYM